MSETWYDPTPILQAVAGAFDHSSDVVVQAISAAEPRRTGRLAAGYSLAPLPGSERVWWAGIVNREVYAGPVDRGAYLRGRRGPHMRGNQLVRKTVQSFYGREMRAAIPGGYRARRTTVRASRVTLR